MNPAERLFLERYFVNPGRNLLRFSFVFMVLGIVLSVGILSAALNLFEGYERALKSVLLDSFPHIRVQSGNQDYLADSQTAQAVAQLSGQKEVASAIPNLSFNLMAFNGERSQGALLSAYGLPEQSPPHWSKYVTSGTAKPAPGNVVVGHYLARGLGLALGDTIQLMYPRLDRISPLGMYPGTTSLRIAGLYRSGYYEFDRSLILCSVADARSILGIDEGFSSIEVKLDSSHLEDSELLAVKYNLQLGENLQAHPVANITLLRIVKMQKWLIFVIFSFLVLIAGINVISCVVTQIFDKKNEIAVMKALGAGQSTIRNILGYQLTLVCLISILLGQLFGILLSWLAVKQNFYSLKGDVYFIDRLELFVSPLNQAVIFTVAAFFVVLCVRIPLRRIDRMQVIDLLRNP